MRELEVFIPNNVLDDRFVGGAVREFRDVGIRDLSVVSCHHDKLAFRVLLNDDVDESVVTDDEAVLDFQRLSKSTPEYLLVADLPVTFIDGCPVTVVCGHDVSVRADGLELSVIAEHSVIQQIGTRIQNTDLACEVLRIRDYEGSVSDARKALTSRQSDIILHAYREGYYETPRETTLSELADDLGIDESTVAEHLQRAEKNVLEHALVGTE
ncbi:hypothetical protein BRC81_08120 [Halobacteriales archaeon QS_1_68_20]|nr:MAG: hypothetical protein BRC81_08120 [Halobacteriales archaeon QS_1_68_20]